MKDTLGRSIDYLRISITDRCNLRCEYCMPAGGVPVRPHDEILRYEEIERLALVARSLGFEHFRITGGEPLARRGSAAFIGRLAGRLAGSDVALTTNGVLLAPVAAQLRGAGLGRVNVSLDTLDSAKFARLTRRDLWAEAWAGIEESLAVGFDPVKVNVVLIKGFNDDEIHAFADLTAGRPLHVRFIELMPLGEGTGMPEGFMSADEATATLERSGGLVPLAGAGVPAGAGPAESYRWRGGLGTVGFISALSHMFCDRCNRLRLTADGRLLPCLAGGEHLDLRGPLRDGAGDDQLAAVFRLAVEAKPASHHMADAPAEAGRVRRMSRIGG